MTHYTNVGRTLGFQAVFWLGVAWCCCGLHLPLHEELGSYPVLVVFTWIHLRRQGFRLHRDIQQDPVGPTPPRRDLKVGPRNPRRVHSDNDG